MSGTFDEHTTFPTDDWRSHTSLFEGEALRRNVETVRKLEHFARERGHSVSQLAIAWTLAQPGVDVSIVGSRRAEHIQESLGALDMRLSTDDRAAIDGIMAGAARVGGPTPEGV